MDLFRVPKMDGFVAHEASTWGRSRSVLVCWVGRGISYSSLGFGGLVVYAEFGIRNVYGRLGRQAARGPGPRERNRSQGFVRFCFDY